MPRYEGTSLLGIVVPRSSSDTMNRYEKRFAADGIGSR